MCVCVCVAVVFILKGTQGRGEEGAAHIQMNTRSKSGVKKEYIQFNTDSSNSLGKLDVFEYALFEY